MSYYFLHKVTNHHSLRASIRMRSILIFDELRRTENHNLTYSLTLLYSTSLQGIQLLRTRHHHPVDRSFQPEQKFEEQNKNWLEIVL